MKKNNCWGSSTDRPTGRYSISRYLFGLLILFSLQTVTVFGQDNSPGTITGRIISHSTSEPLSGANISVKGTSVSTTADEKGGFAIHAKTGDILLISSVGYVTKEVKVGRSVTLDVSMERNYSDMQDVVVIGYGTMKKTDLSSSQVTVTAADIHRTINTTLDQALQGRAANVDVTSSSGQPGAAPSVIVRGISTLTGSAQPLYVIDGVQIKPDNVSDDPYNHPTGFSNILSSINPDDIETINILQGPSATSIFGAVGANGVVMITTKHGRAGQTKISVTSLVSLQDKPKHIDVMNLPEYAAFRNEMAKAGGTASEADFADPAVLGSGTDWQNALFRRTLLQKHGIALSGGNEKTTFYFSGEYFSQEGIAPGSGFDRYTTRLNLENNTRKWLKLGTNLSVGLTKEKINTTNGGIIGLALQQNPGVSVKNPDGTWGGPATTQFQFTNPVMLANIYNDYNKRLAFIGGGYADISPIKGLVIHNEVNTSIEYYNYYSFHPGYTAGGYVVTQDNATSTRTANNNYWWNINTRIQYETRIHKHSISAMVAHEAQAWGGESVTGSRKGFVTNDVQELSAGDANTLSNVSNSSSKSDGSKESYFGRLNYVYNDRYILQAIMRADGSSNFGLNNKWGYFPALSVAWRISQEKFMKNMTAISDLKLRFEIGTTGNSGNASGIYSPLQSVPTPWGNGFLAQKFPNADLKWETDKTVDVGFDLHMFNSRLEVIADAYVKNISDLITINTYPFTLGGDISYSAGYIQWPTVNAGSMHNKGFGVTVNTVNIDNKALTWKTGLNFSVDRNKITSLLNTINVDYSATQVELISREGQPVSMITGYTAEGLFQNYKDITGHAIQTSNGVMTVAPRGTWVGDVKYKDINGDGVIDEQDRTVIGNPWPKFTFGFNNAISYKNFDLNIFVTGSVGNKVVNYPRYQMELPGNSGVYGNYYSSVANFARLSSYSIADSSDAVLLNPGHNIPRIDPGGPSGDNGNNRMSQWYVEDGSYLRVKNVTLSYNFPRKWISRLAMTGLHASMSVQNLLTITGYSGYDPEIGMVNYGGTLMVGVDTGRYPAVRLYSFSLSADF